MIQSASELRHIAYGRGEWPQRMRKLKAIGIDRIRDQEVLVLCDLALSMEESQREAFLASACAENPALRAAVDRLLQAVNDSGNFLKLSDAESTN